MQRAKLFLILAGIILILLDKFAFIGNVRDWAAVLCQKQYHLLVYRLQNYPKLLILQKTRQTQLEKENSQLRALVQQYSLVIKEQHNNAVDATAVAALRSEAKLYESYRTTTVRAVIDINYLVNNKLLIDKGSDNTLAIGEAVVNNDGVIGQIGKINSHNAQIILITNPDYKIYLANKLSGSKVLAQGIGNNHLLVRYISKTDKLKAGDILVTTGLDDVLPANIPVAKVNKIFYENNGFNSALCEPVVNFNKLKYILVLEPV